MTKIPNSDEFETIIPAVVTKDSINVELTANSDSKSEYNYLLNNIPPEIL